MECKINPTKTLKMFRFILNMNSMSPSNKLSEIMNTFLNHYEYIN